MSKYPQTTETITDDSFKGWAHEGFEIAKADVYPDFKENRYPTKFYRERALPILEKRMAQGGRRMADLLISIFDGQKKQSTFADLISNDDKFLQWIQEEISDSQYISLWEFDQSKYFYH